MKKLLILAMLVFTTIFIIFKLEQSPACTSGPCLDISDHCGGYGGENRCVWNGISCSGDCASSCAAGSPDEYCVGMFGNCTPSVVNCNPIITYICQPRMLGLPDCVCVKIGNPGSCIREDC